MSKEKQIEEMAKVIDDIAHNAYIENYDDAVADSDKIAKDLYNAGYRKQSEGEWIKDEESKFEHRYHCSVCNFYLIGEPTKYCEDCGAKMKSVE